MLFVAERAGVYRLIDEIVLAQRGKPVLAGEALLVWCPACQAGLASVLMADGCISPSMFHC